MAFLVLNPGSASLSVFDLKPDVNSIGRDACNDLMLSDASVSGAHCEIIVTGETVLLRDLDSTNGSFINGSRVKEAHLASGQTIRIGNVEVVILIAPVFEACDSGALPSEQTMATKGAPIARKRRRNVIARAPEMRCPLCGSSNVHPVVLPSPEPLPGGCLFVGFLIDPLFLPFALCMRMFERFKIEYGLRCDFCTATWRSK